MNKIWIWVLVVVIVLGGGWYLMKDKQAPVMDADGDEAVSGDTTTMPVPGTETKETEVNANTQGIAPGEPNPSAPTSQTNKTVPVTSNVREFTVSATNYEYDVKKITVKKGEKVRIVFKNTEGFHDWVIDQFQARTKQIKAGQSETIEFVASTTGSFEYYCSVGNHRQFGMKGTLVVE